MPVLLLEHVNFKVPVDSGPDTIQRFFVDVLGCPVCPSGRLNVAEKGGQVPVGQAKQMHVNLGLSQIHFEWCTGYGKPYRIPQRLAGSLTVAVDSLRTLGERLRSANHAFAQASPELITFVCPFGNTWRCVEAGASWKAKMQRASPIRTGGVGHVLALARVDMDVQPGLAEEVAWFYRDHFAARIARTGSGFDVHTLAGQVVAFNETGSAPPPDAYESANELRGIHFCMYVSEFAARCRQLESLFWVNPEYAGPPLNDQVRDVPGALARVQFRLRRVSARFVLEHEVRGLQHAAAPDLSCL
jgi:hypothetical protein